MAVIHRMQYGQPCTMVAVRICPKLMFHLVAFKIHPFSQLDDTVFTHSRFPHQITSRCVILRILNSCPQIADYATHQCFGNIIGHIGCIRIAEISLHDMGKNIETSRCHLEFRYTVSVGRIKQGKQGIALRVVPSGLYFQFLIGNDRTAITLAASTCHGNDHPKGKRLKVKTTRSFPEIFPNISLISGRNGNCFAAIHHTAAAYAQQQTYIVFSCQLCAFQHLCVSRICHDSRKLDHRLSCGSEDRHYFLIHSVFLNGTAAIAEHHSIAILFCQARQIFLDTAFSKIDLRCVFKNKVVHFDSSCIISFAFPRKQSLPLPSHRPPYRFQFQNRD